MAAISINDLQTNRTLDRKAMSYIKGGDGARWLFGSFVPYSNSSSFGSVVNFYQINNNSYYADQMNNLIQVVDINNSGSNSNINVALNENGSNTKANALRAGV